LNFKTLKAKCLELFIEELIVESAKITKSKQAKTITINHLKETIEQNEKFDFLSDLMNKY
jgi:Dr1-associated corepressor